MLNKIDLLPEEELQSKVQDLIKRLKWKGKVFQISAIKKLGTKELCYKLMDHFISKK